ncbi:hypothetical protein PSHT_04772 [Puccinia striiformis]|uniref:Secreted protein n=1 Tax=Puccinia striiformis TaxID=27350 RepID=A0A2S4WC76_9BASI|nr:hypothetical protein PSHT_04772 [Puccinia striiformis]
MNTPIWILLMAREMLVAEQPSEGVSLRDGDTSLAIPTAFRQDSFISTDIRSNNVFTSINRFPSTRHGSGSVHPHGFCGKQVSSTNVEMVPADKGNGHLSCVGKKKNTNWCCSDRLTFISPGVALGSVVTGACVTGRKPSHHRG